MLRRDKRQEKTCENKFCETLIPNRCRLDRERRRLRCLDKFIVVLLLLFYWPFGL